MSEQQLPGQTSPSPPDSMAAHPLGAARARFLSGAFLVAFLGTLGVAYAINVFGNSQDIFPFRVHCTSNERVWKARRLARLVEEQTPPTGLIFGSSRMFPMSPAQVQQITGAPTFNCAFRGCDLFEQLAFFRYALALGIVPKVAIIAVDEQMFVSGGPHRMRLMGEWGLFRTIPLRDRLDIGLSILKRLDLRGTYRSLRELLAPQAEPLSNTEVTLSQMGIFLGDGYLVKTQARQWRDGTFDAAGRIARQIRENRISVAATRAEGQAALPASEWKHLLELLDEAQRLGVKVYLLTPPNHPALDDSRFGDERRRLLPELRRRLTEEAAARGFVYHDFSDFRVFGGDERGFWDGIHQAPENMQKMTNALFGRPVEADLDKIPNEIELLESAEKKWGFRFD